MLSGVGKHCKLKVRERRKERKGRRKQAKEKREKTFISLDVYTVN